MKIRKNDFVIVMAGNDKGKTGQVKTVLQDKNKVVIDGINKKIKHLKPRQGEPGQRVEFFAPIDVSNVAIIDEKTKKPTRIGFKIEGKTKSRIAKKSGEVIEQKATVKKVKKTETPTKEKTAKKTSKK